jgi:hypothetical protein
MDYSPYIDYNRAKREREKVNMATRTAPLFTAAVTRRLIGLRLIDSSGDYYTESIEVAVSATAAAIEQFASDYAAASQASLYSIVDMQERNGADLPSNANTFQRNSIKDGINVLYKVPATGETDPLRIVAPQPAIMNGDLDQPLTTASLFTDLRTATLALKTGFSYISAQFTERRERRNNKRVS